MDRAEAIGRLPTTYAAIISLLDEGVDEPGIAQRLGVDVATIGPLVTVARAKLARLLADGSKPSGS
jgi:DNA-directed RNA polymerase specialized sigma24 family protein